MDDGPTTLTVAVNLYGSQQIWTTCILNRLTQCKIVNASSLLLRPLFGLHNDLFAFLHWLIQTARGCSCRYQVCTWCFIGLFTITWGQHGSNSQWPSTKLQCVLVHATNCCVPTLYQHTDLLPSFLRNHYNLSKCYPCQNSNQFLLCVQSWYHHFLQQVLIRSAPIHGTDTSLLCLMLQFSFFSVAYLRNVYKLKEKNLFVLFLIMFLFFATTTTILHANPIMLIIWFDLSEGL